MVRTEQQHLDLVPLHHPVLLQLVLNLLVPLLSLLLLGTHSATHGDGSGVIGAILRCPDPRGSMCPKETPVAEARLAQCHALRNFQKHVPWVRNARL